MFGISDGWISLAFLVCLLSAAACIVYGIYNWNRGAEDENREISEERKWEKEEIEIDDNM